jgi:hypothetical protein
LAWALATSGTQSFIAENQSTVVLAFHGTEPDDPTDLFTDVDFALTRWPAGGNVHVAFANALGAVWEGVRSHMPQGKRVLFTAHSPGAALATLASTLQRPAALFTGSPRVSDEEFVPAGGQIDHTRYEDCSVPGSRHCRSEPFGYRHCGSWTFIDRQGRVLARVSEEEIDIERRETSTEYPWRWGFQIGTVPFRELADHAPLNFSSAVFGSGNACDRAPGGPAARDRRGNDECSSPS